MWAGVHVCEVQMAGVALGQAKLVLHVLEPQCSLCVQCGVCQGCQGKGPRNVTMSSDRQRSMCACAHSYRCAWNIQSNIVVFS